MSELSLAGNVALVTSGDHLFTVLIVWGGNAVSLYFLILKQFGRIIVGASCAMLLSKCPGLACIPVVRGYQF